jgi:UDP-N-acetylglucosamine diphosphorylase/glucosamine-1-phosphate N-acetyltransferase
LKRLYLYDDAPARAFEPFALTRPVSELRAGALLIRERWQRATGTGAYGFIGADHLSGFQELDSPPAVRSGSTIPAGSVVANSRFVVALDARLDDTSPSFVCDGEICAVRIRKPMDLGGLEDGSLDLASLAPQDAVPTAIAGRWAREVWDLVGQLEAQLMEDIPLLGAELSGATIDNATVIGRHRVFLETGANVDPFVVFDSSHGPILIRRGATVAPFTKIFGPTYIGEHTQIVGDAIRGCSIGDVCKVRGEISATILLGHSNKGHTGFVGNSYLGRWVNLGAGTITSNLKNTYGPIALWTPTGVRDTGLQFLGALMGDHAKLGIGSLVNTGTVIGAGANVFGANVTPKYIPPFAWGEAEPWDRIEFDKFCEIAERVMERRNMVFDETAKNLLASAYFRSAADE